MTFCLAPYRPVQVHIYKGDLSMEVMTFCLAPYKTSVTAYLQR